MLEILLRDVRRLPAVTAEPAGAHETARELVARLGKTMLQRFGYGVLYAVVGRRNL